MKVQPWTCFWGVVGVLNGRARYWENASFLHSRSPMRDLGYLTRARVWWTWCHDHFWQVVTIFYLERCKLHPPDGQSLGKLCWPLNWSIQQHHRGPLVSSKLKLKALNRTTKAKLPGYLHELNWNKLHQEGNLGDRFHHMLSHIAEIFPLN